MMENAKKLIISVTNAGAVKDTTGRSVNTKSIGQTGGDKRLTSSTSKQSVEEKRNRK